MVQTYDIFQCFPVRKPEVLSRVISRYDKIGCRILLDLEDGLLDLNTPQETITRKIEARKILATIKPPKQGFDIRINELDSLEFKYDMELLRKISTTIRSIFIPKVESVDSLSKFYEWISNNTAPIPKISIILESESGLTNINKLLTAIPTEAYEFIYFGNYDYHLDKQIFPVKEQNTKEYWTLVDILVNEIETNGCCFGNSPFTNLGDISTLQSSIVYLQTLCKNKFAVMSLGGKQTDIMLNEKNEIYKPFNFQNSVLVKTTEETITLYEKHIAKGRSFSFSNTIERIITPQEYQLALLYQNK